MIALVIEACQMQDAVQYQNFYFFGNRMSQADGVLPCNICGDRHIAATRLVWRGTALGAGNDNTSVGLSIFRNCRLRQRNSRLLVTSTFTVSRKRIAFLALNTNRSSVGGLSPAILFRKIITLFK